MEKKSSRHGARRVRRIFTVLEKRRVVEESRRPGASVIKVARRHRLSTALLFRWRRQEKEGLFAVEPAAPAGDGQGLDAGAA
jgi:transposase